MEVHDNPSVKPSGLRPPSKVQTSLPLPTTKGLVEMTASDNNVRIAPSTGTTSSTMGPPPGSLKHRPYGLPESQPKQRKTLKDRAAEPIRPPSATSTYKESISGRGPVARNGFSSSTRVPPPTRTTSNSSYGQSTFRASAMPRPNTALGHSRTNSYGGSLKQGHAQDRRGFSNSSQPAAAPAALEDTSETQFKDFQNMFTKMQAQMTGTTFAQNALKELVEMLKARVTELEGLKSQMATTIDSLRGDLETAKAERAEAERALEDARRALEIEIDDVERKNRYEMEDLREEHRRELERIRRAATDDQEHERKKAQEEIDRLLRNHREELASLERQLKTQLEAEQERRIREVADMASQRDMQLQSIAGDIGKKERETETIRHELDLKASEIEREKSLRSTLETKIAEVSASMLTLEGANRAMKAKIDFLESDNQAQSQAFADLHKRMQEAIEAAEESNAKLRAEETLRRKLHNQIQELKGNIRVFCRVRPPLGSEVDEAAKINFPDQQEESKEVVVTGPEQKSALGNVTAQNHAFSFDRVFGPGSANGQVFEEISQLVQSALDGYNVCIFCYGQTGSGKTHTMSSPDGMIPLAVKQIYDTAKTLGDKGWTYRMEGSFIEVYNENLNDLLGTADDIDKKKHEIRHDPAKCKTTVTDITKVELDSPERVQEVLKRADGNRSVAATKANMRSSRSHSVFILSLVGENSITGERSEGTLNLVDLAGSERLSHSQAEGQRLKETQNINKSLSCLGDVIAALGKGDGGHVPYRNSKLTYLLQFSLGGNSKTLMFVMISPLQAHLSETLTSLKFATKVHNTHIGTAKRQVKTKD